MSMPYRLRNASGEDWEVASSQDSPRNEALAANMKRLMAGRSIETVRLAMAEKGLKIGAGTLHRAVRGEAGNRLESLEKIALFFGVTAEQLLQPEGVGTQVWPFSLELQDAVLNAPPEDLHYMEVAMWSHLRRDVPSELHFDDADERSEAAPRKPTTIIPTRSPSQQRLKKSS